MEAGWTRCPALADLRSSTSVTVASISKLRGWDECPERLEHRWPRPAVEIHSAGDTVGTATASSSAPEYHPPRKILKIGQGEIRWGWP
jgi:hypothetical protein